MATHHPEVDHYLKGLGFGLVKLPPRAKRPLKNGWQNSPITSPEEAEKAFRRGDNIGLHHAVSGTAVLDIDHPEWAKLALAAVGIDLDALLDAPDPKIRGAKGLKPLYRLPEGLELTRKALQWHEPATPKALTVFELRAGKVQDVLPPSIHPDTGKPYVWEPAMPQSRKEISELPGSLRALWENWDALKPTLLAAQPWFKPTHPTPTPSQQPPVSGGTSIIAAFNDKHDVHTLLQSHGYKQDGPERYLSPHSSTGMAGIHILRGEHGNERVFCHHGSDPLSSDHSHDAFGLWCLLEHSGDTKAAVKAAAELLGLTPRHRTNTSPASTTSEPTEAVVTEPEAPWDDRHPLPGFYPPVPPLPPKLIPDPLRPWLSDIAERASLPLEFVACPALVALSAVVGRKVGIHPKEKDDWLVVPNLWGGIVGKPGVMKSAAISEPTKPLRALVSKAREQYQQQAAEAEAERARLELEIAALKENEKRAAKGRYKSE